MSKPQRPRYRVIENSVPGPWKSVPKGDFNSDGRTLVVGSIPLGAAMEIELAGKARKEGK